MKNNSVNTRFFNFRLFLEALKRLRVVGLGSAILALTASALVPAVTWIEMGSFTRTEVYEMETHLLCVPAGVMVALAPLFFAVLFSFLQSRKESDFFHAIPYTRTCVYVSFVTAALAFVWAIQMACGLVAGILWGMIPRLAADIGGMIAYVGVSMLAAAMFSSFMMLALTVSGTSGSCALLFCLFAGFVRVVCAIFLGCMDTFFIIDTNGMWDTSVLSPLWLQPINIFAYLIEPTAAATTLYSPANILYSLCVAVAVFTFSGLLYNRRKSEMAGNPAPGVRTQALFRILFTILPALLIPLLLVTGDAEGAIMLVLVVGVLLVYFLYELITTKRPKNLLKIFPGLGIVAGACVAFLLVFGAYYAVAVNETVTPSEVKWVSVDSNGFTGSSYQGRLSDTLRTGDDEIVKLVTDRLAVSQKYEREGIPTEGYDQEYYDRMRVTIRLKGGRTLHRYIAMGQQARESLQNRFASLEEVKQIMFLLPEDSEIQTGGIELGYSWEERAYIHLGDATELRALMNIFRAEFETLTDAQKLTVMAPALNTYSYSNREDYYDAKEEYGSAISEGLILSVHGTVKGGGRRFTNEYVITDALPKTREAMVYLWGANQMDFNDYSTGYSGNGGSVESVLTQFANDAAESDFAAAFPRLKGPVTIMGLSAGGEKSSVSTTFILEAKDYIRFAELLKKTVAITQSTKEESFFLTEDTYYLNLRDDQDGKYSNIRLDLRGVFRFTPEELEELKEILHIEK
ncbi:MAG: hypothetical protein IJD38_06700 [Clostridia bacterium]|nr:hypothetical protein [Clostridia bacterium]